MQCDRKIDLLISKQARSSNWTPTKILWSEFVKYLAEPKRGTDTEAEYAMMAKPEKDNLKDIGGFVGGAFEGRERKQDKCLTRDVLTFDLDDIKASTFNDLLARIDRLQASYVLYSTRSHTVAAPRIRLVVLLDRPVTPDEFQPVARRIGDTIDPGMKTMDPCTFRIHQPMYWPCCCADAEYIYKVGDYPNCVSADGVLGTYTDWHNAAEWPLCFREDGAKLSRNNRLQDPASKENIVGDFCRAFSIEDVLERFLPGVYEQTDRSDDRYTFVGGSSYGGAVVYDGKWLYSNHATDPASGKACNAFDLVRLHKFGHLDYAAADGTPPGRLPSYQEMSRLVLDQPEFREQKERDVAEAIASICPKEDEPSIEDAAAQIDIDPSAKKKINFKPVYESNGELKRTIDNAWCILETDEQLKGRIVKNVFSNRGVAIGPYPWDDTPGERTWSDNDDKGAQWYLERVYKFSGKDAVISALSLCGTHHCIDPVRDYLDSLEWDHTERLDRLFVDYLGAPDTAYVRTVTRKAFVAAVARTYEPGVKFDNMTILTGPQGIGKSTLLDKMGKDWFSDSLQSFEGKEARELIQGTWINEIGELGYMNKQETNQIKQFLSQRVDLFRAAYGKHPEERPRRCVFFGTTNEDDFLKDTTGNRRFWPVDVGVQAPAKSVFDELDAVVDQLWAEAVVRYKAGERLYLSKEMEALAVEQQDAHRQENTFEGMVIDYLNREAPEGWLQMDRNARMGHRSDMPVTDTKTEPRQFVCANEIWEWALSRRLDQMKPLDTKAVNAIIRSQPGWEPDRYYDSVYGRVRGFKKV